MEEIELISPAEYYQKQIEDYIQDYLIHNELEIIGASELLEYTSFDNWLEMIKNNSISNSSIIPSSVYFTLRKADNKIIGNIKINHYLNENLFNNVGHIKHSICPSERNKGYGTKQLNLALKKCKELGIGRVLLETDRTNIASINTIINNGGILENSKENINNRYWISLKKRYANRHKLKHPDSNLIFLKNSVDDNSFNGDITYYNFKDSGIKVTVPSGYTVIDNNYKLLEFYDYSKKIKLSTFFNPKNEIIEWYFDIAVEIGKENDVLYEDDLYLDVLVKPDGKIKLLDEDELKNALDKFEITYEEYQMAYDEANKLIKMIDGKIEQLRSFTYKYLNFFENLV